MTFDDSLFSKLETLAKLKSQPEQRSKIKKDLENILQMVQKLESLNTEGVEPLVYLNEPTQTTRPDKVNGQLPKEDALVNAPEHNDDFFTIPKVIDL